MGALFIIGNGFDLAHSLPTKYQDFRSVLLENYPYAEIATDAIWYFTEHDACNKETLRIKKIKLRRYGFKGSFNIYEG